MRLSQEFWNGRRVFLTGHTGFKGAWLALLLDKLGAEIYGYSLPAAGENHLHGLLSTDLAGETLGDIRDQAQIHTALDNFQPEVVLHLAAQSLVRASYADPIETMDVNVIGTATLLNAVRAIPSIKSVLIVTTDKVYENLESGLPFSEADRLGGHDPYSTSKACAELVVTSFRKSFFSKNHFPVITSVRAGNVIGGGDWAADRLVPDIVRAIASEKSVQLRYPFSVRPWMYVLEPIFGYLLLVQQSICDPDFCHQTFNFAPALEESKTVADLVDAFSIANGGNPGWIHESGKHPKEAGLLTLSSSYAEKELGWRAQLSFESVVNWTSNWYRAFASGEDMLSITKQQIDDYLALLESEESRTNTEAMKVDII